MLLDAYLAKPQFGIHTIFASLAPAGREIGDAPQADDFYGILLK
jgi:hypothetical protein